MSVKTTLLAAAAAVAFALPALAGEIMVQDPYVRTSTMMSKSGAAFMVLMNPGDEDDRLVAAASDVAQRVELHTHKEDANGVMRMVEVEEGFPVPAHGSHALARGGDHVMFMGLNRSLAQGDVVTLTLTFEKAGDMTIEVPVDLERTPAGGMQMQHGKKMKTGG
ncbi:copper chaperone PCu(A)C [Pseudodonghicola flavimaris]|uniref:Copper chaperone PCu(A)C n=1 Tax=Pseudodonghicola flavimaris TaxID=3050036 RepID=A0ABT7EYX4_9RHOB|nr:copper chaperone PCu(A)C [Pseudodonghicola flavimaris]MDK3017524.1 copper chaperone PCu(A)C [Pseudodonghicola flavimaris]